MGGNRGSVDEAGGGRSGLFGRAILPRPRRGAGISAGRQPAGAFGRVVLAVNGLDGREYR